MNMMATPLALDREDILRAARGKGGLLGRLFVRAPLTEIRLEYVRFLLVLLPYTVEARKFPFRRHDAAGIMSVAVNTLFGTCAMKIDGRLAEPPEYTRGAIARTSLYMEDAYSVYKMSGAQRKLMQAWDKMHPVDQWECLRAKRIEAVQGNENKFVSEPCRRKDWY